MPLHRLAVPAIAAGAALLGLGLYALLRQPPPVPAPGAEGAAAPVPATAAPVAEPVAEPVAVPAPPAEVPPPERSGPALPSVPALLDVLQAAVEGRRWEEADAAAARLEGRSLEAAQERRRATWLRRLGLRRALAAGRITPPMDCTYSHRPDPLAPGHFQGMGTVQAGRERRLSQQPGQAHYLSPRATNARLAELLDYLDDLGLDALSLQMAGREELALLAAHPGIRRLHLANYDEGKGPPPSLASLRSLALDVRRGATVQALLAAAPGLEELSLVLTGNGEQPVGAGWVEAMARLPWRTWRIWRSWSGRRLPTPGPPSIGSPRCRACAA